MKKLLSLLLVLALVLPCVALADNEAASLAEAVSSIKLETPELPLVNEPMTLTVMFKKASNYQTDFENMFQVKAIEQVTGIKLQLDVIESAAWAEKLPLAMMGEEYGKIFIDGLSFSDAASFGQDGYLIPLEDLLREYAPNAVKILDTLPNGWKNVTASDGHVYLMPGYNGTPRDMLANIFQEINGEWLTAVGMEAPDTLKGFYDMLVAFKTKDPNSNGEADEIPWSFVWDNGTYNMVLGAFGFVSGRHDVIDNKYVYVPAQENYRHYVEFMAKLYAEGLLDSEVFTQTNEQYTAKKQQMIVGFTPNNHYNTIGLDNYLKMVNCKPLTSEYNDTPMHPGNLPEVPTFGMAITNKASEEEAIAAIKLLDYFYSEEGTFLTKCGPEYGAWGDMVDGGYIRTENEDGSYSYKLVAGEAYKNNYARFRQTVGLWSLPFFYSSAHEACIVGSDPGNNHITTKAFESGMVNARRLGYHGMITFTYDEQDILAGYTLMDSYVDRTVASWISGETELNDETWAAYLAELDAFDIDEMIKVRQDAYDRYNK